MKLLLRALPLTLLIFFIVFFAQYQYTNSKKAKEKFPVIVEKIQKIDRILNANLIRQDETLTTMTSITYTYQLKSNIDMDLLSIQLSQLGWVELSNDIDYRNYCENDIRLGIGKSRKKGVDLYVSVIWNVEFYYPEKCYKKDYQ